MKRFLLFCGFLALAATAHAQTSEPDEPGSAAREGIHVSGAWTIEVFNPDGTLAERREFQNALTNPQIIAQMMTGQRSAGFWAVRLAGGICLNGATPWDCDIIDEDWPNAAGTAEFKNLIITTPTGGADANKIVLSGLASAQRSASITRVDTQLTVCHSATAPDNCANTVQYLGFTSKTLSPAISVSNGQIVNVRVVIGFN